MAKSAIGTAYFSVQPTTEGFVKSLGKDIDSASSQIEDKVAEPFESAGEEAGDKFTKGFDVGLAALGAAVTGTVVAATKGLFDLGSEWKDVTNDIRVGTGASGADLKEFEDITKEVARSVPNDFSSVGNSVADLNTALDLTGPALSKVSEQLMKASTMGVDVSIADLGQAINAFNRDAEDTPELLDWLWTVAQNTGVDIDKLTNTMYKHSAALTTLGLGYEESASLIGALEKAGVRSEDVLRGMRNGLQNLAEAGEDVPAVYRATIEEMDALIKAGNSEEARNIGTEMFGRKGANEFVLALESGRAGVDALTGAAEMAGDTIEEAYQDTATWAEHWATFKNKALLALEPVASTIFNGLGNALERVMPMFEGLFNWIDNNEKLFSTIVITIGALAGVIGVVATALGTLGVIFPAIAAGWGMVSAAAGVFNTVLLANPITWIIAAVVALIAIIVLLVKNWDKVSEALSVVWDKVVGFIAAVGEGILQVIDFVVELASAWNDMLTEAWSSLIEWFGDIASAFEGWVTGIVTKIGEVILSAKEFLGTLAEGVVEGIKNAFNGIVEGIKAVINGASNLVKSSLTGIGNFFTNLKNVVVNVFKGIGSSLLGIVNIGINGINGLINALNHVKINVPSWVPGIGGASWGINLPTVPTLAIPALATGADIMGPTIALLGEKDPETVVNRGTMNDTLRKMERRLDLAERGNSVNERTVVHNDIVIKATSTMSAKEIAEEVARRALWETKR